jgi:hypothetical protein
MLKLSGFGNTTGVLRAAGMALALALAAPAAQAELDDNGSVSLGIDSIIKSATVDDVYRLMQSEGYSVEMKDKSIIWRIDGFRTLMLISDSGSYVQFHSSFSDGNATLKKVNDWNRTKIFSHSYMDDEGDPHLELELDLEGGVTRARFIDYLLTCKVSFSAWLDKVVR